MDSDDDLRARVARSVEGLPAAEIPPIEPVAARAKHLRRRRLVASGAVGLLGIAGVAVPLVLLSSLGSKPQPRAAATSAPLPDVAEIVCDQAGTHVLTPQIRPQRDGVHFTVDNRTAAEIGFDVRTPEGGGGGEGIPPGKSRPLDPGTGRLGWPFAPGTATVRCLDHVDEPNNKGGFVPLDVIDLDGVWLPYRLDCSGMVAGSGGPFYVDDKVGEKGTPVGIVRRLYAKRLKEGDLVEVAGYPEARDRVVRIVRDGKILAYQELRPGTVSGWFLDASGNCL